MKITPSNILNIYSANRKPVVLPTSKQEPAKASGVKMDTVVIHKKNISDNPVEKLSAGIVEDVVQEDSPEKIARLKALIENNQYDSSGKGIAGAIVDKFYNFKKDKTQ